MRVKILSYLQEILILFVKKVLIYDVALILIVALSFLFTKGFSATALSERLIWTGIGVSALGGILVFGQTSGGRNYGLAPITAAHASVLTEFNIEVRQDVNRKFSPFMRLFLIGTVCFGAGVLVQVLFPV
jgi:hypothetical protein